MLAALAACTVLAGALSGGSSASVVATTTTAPSQELPPLAALSPIGAVAVLGFQATSPTIHWQFPSRSGKSQYWVTLDDSALQAGVKHTAGSLTTVVSDWIYFPDGLPLADGTSSGPGWALYFYGSFCGGQNWWVMADSTIFDPINCPQGAWEALAGAFDGVPGSWIPVGPAFEGCYYGIQWYGGTCLARFIPAADMSQYVTPTTDVQIWDSQPVDAWCPVSSGDPSCWAGAPPPPLGMSVDVRVESQLTPVTSGTTTNRFMVGVANTNDHDVAVSSLVVDLPAGFSYGGNLSNNSGLGDPTVSGQRLTWAGPFVLGSNRTLIMSFDLHLDKGLAGGDYSVTASAVTDDTYSGTGTLTIDAKPTPLIVVPGILGSTLSCSVPGIGSTNYWPDSVLDATLFPKLALKDDGSHESKCSYPLTADDFVENFTVIPHLLVYHEYDQTINGLEAAGYVLGSTLFEYPYDWRRSVGYSADGLLELIDKVRAQTNSPKVDILAHSQGGLVTRFALTEPASVGKVRRVLTMGTPYYGAGKLLAVLLTGKPCIPKDFSFVYAFWRITACPTNGNAVQDVLRTMPGAYDLLPDQSYFGAVRPPIITYHRAYTPAEYQTFLEGNSDAALVDSALQYHATYDGLGPADPTVQWRQVLGVGTETMDEIYLSNDPELPWATVLYGDGDGTVPTNSAESGGLFATSTETGIDHMGLVTNDCSLYFAVHYFQDKTSPDSGGCATGGGGTFLSLQDVLPPATEIAVDGSLAGSVTDAGDNTSGDGGAAPIPNSDVNVWGMSQSILLRDPGAYHATFTAAGTGIARIRVRSLGLDGPLDQALFLIPALPKGAQVSFDATAQDVGATRVAVDLNGDGTTDEVLAPNTVTSGSAAADTTPPTAYGDATLSGLFSSRVTLGADDAESGVDQIYYRVGSGPEQTYTGPFTVRMFSTISFRAMDGAGNMSLESSFVADDAPNTQRFADPLTPFRPLLRFLDPQGDVDWFTFQSNGTSRYRVQLDQLPGDYDVQLFDSAGNLVAAPRVRGRGPETIFQSLPAGAYYVEVGAATSTRGADRPWDHVHPYGLELLAVPGR